MRLSLRSVSVFSRHDTRFFLEYLREILRSVKPIMKASTGQCISLYCATSACLLIRIWRTEVYRCHSSCCFHHYYSTLRLYTDLRSRCPSILSPGLPAFSTTNLKTRIMVLSWIQCAINASSLFGSTASVLGTSFTAWLRDRQRNCFAGSIRRAAMASLSPVSSVFWWHPSECCGALGEG